MYLQANLYHLLHLMFYANTAAFLLSNWTAKMLLSFVSLVQSFQNTKKCAHQSKAFENMKHPKPFDLPSWSDLMNQAGGLLPHIVILSFLSYRVPKGSIFPSHRPPDTVFKITFWLGYFNSCLNPIIYPCFSQEFKKAFQNVLHGRCLSRTHKTWSPPASCRDPTNLHGPKSPQGLPSRFTDCWRVTNESPSAVILNECSFTAHAHSNSVLNSPDTSLTLKGHQVSICKMEGEAL